MRGRCQEILVMTNLDLPYPAGTHAAVPEREDHPLACRRHAFRARCRVAGLLPPTPMSVGMRGDPQGRLYTYLVAILN